MSLCPDCEGIRQKRHGAWWCFWCRIEEPEPDVKQQLQDRWNRHD